MRTDDFVNFIRARHYVYLNRAAGKPKPWTDDFILQRYRFCNVYRELDKVTVWIAKNWRAKLAKSDDLWYWMLVARLVNNPETLTVIQKLHEQRAWKFSERLFVDAIRTRMLDGEKAWGGAYIVSTNGNKMEKASYIAERVLAPAWSVRADVAPHKGDDLDTFCARLLKLNGVQGFIAGQVIADAKYASPILRKAKDWDTFAISGPGSRRGLNRVFDQDIHDSWREEDWRSGLSLLREETNKKLKRDKRFQPFHAQDIQNCLCEFDKYERVRLGQGMPRSNYPGE